MFIGAQVAGKVAIKYTPAIVAENTEKSKEDLSLVQDKLHGVTFPKIFYNENQYIGGYTELVEYLKPRFFKSSSKLLVMLLFSVS